ncbi:ABC transporter ATP-binding protein [Haloferax sp. AB510]|uniref:ABC transporter ATP-binding protein n=1 Tax=Haloferax sp. AB510 TaxID=2934172 RepID=UPI00209C35AF|nr:ABC transporter ATP-binding protein [Haloferax sp. AB510]MCO8265410.1 ABC transporter ATP-binding protein [Haloferax sp. AB510]
MAERDKRDVAIRYDNVTKQFGDVTAVDDVSFEVEDGELLALLGPSGSGKTTTLRMLAGFEQPTRGNIILANRDVTYVPPHKRDTGMVFQNYALFPHMTVEENIEFGLKQKGFEKSKIDRRISEVLEMVDLSGFRDREPANLSGGQQQRVATARSLAIKPEVLLMDEPLGALDKKLRDQLEVELTELQSELDIPTLYVTHNQEEALTMADRIAVMNEGQIEQIAPPMEIYEEPATEFVAEFIGDTNFLEGDLETQNGEVRFFTENTEITVNADSTATSGGAVFVRPEKIDVRSADFYDDSLNTFEGTIIRRLFLGSTVRYFVEANGQTLIVDDSNQHSSVLYDTDDDVVLAWSKEDTRIARA